MSAELLIRLPEYFSSLINAMQDGFVLRGTDGTIIEVNDSVCEMLGYRRDEMVGRRPPHPWWPDDQHPTFTDAVARYLSGATVEETLIYQRKNGERFPALVTTAPLHDSEGRVIAYIGMFKDMTEWNRAEEHIRFQAHLIDEVEAAVTATDAEGHVVIWNAGAEYLYGVLRAEAIGQPIVTLIPGSSGDVTGESLHGSVQSGERWEGEYTVDRGEGQSIPIFGSVAPIKDASGAVIGSVGVAVDISQRKRAEERLTAQYRVARDLADAETISNGVEAVLATIGESFGFSLGQWWRVDETSERLDLGMVWRASGTDTDAASAFEDASSRLRFAPGEGLPGRAWAAHQPVWVMDVSRDANLPRMQVAEQSGLRTGIAFPLNGGPTVLGVIEFLSDEPREPDEQLLAALSTVGSQIGQFIERRRAEATMRESEDRFRTMADSAPVLLWIAQADGSCVWFNKRWLDFTGRTIEQESGHGWLEGVHPDDYDRYLAIYLSAVERRQHFQIEYRLRRHDGEYRWLLKEAVPRFESDGVYVGHIGSCVDITERRRSEEDQTFVSEATYALASSLDYETTLVSVAQLAVPRIADWCSVHVLDADGHPTQIAVAHADSAKVVWARELPARYPSDPNAPTGVPRVLRTGEPELYPEIPWEMIEAAAQDAEHLELLRTVGFTSAMIVPIRTSERVLGVLTFVSSELGRHYTERDLDLGGQIGERAGVAIDHARLYQEAQEASRARDQFLAVAAHELRSPLTSMKGFAQLLLRRAQRTAGGEEWIRPLETIDTQVNRVAELVNRLLDVSRIEERRLQLQVAEVDLFELVSIAAAEAQLATDNHSIVIQASGEPVLIEIDASRIQQVLSNLLDNAVKYSPDETVVIINLDASANDVIVSVIDQGPGIPESSREQLFEQYFRGVTSTRSAAEGLGLGLYVAHGIVDAHGGRMWQESDMGVGSTFGFALPRRQPQSPIADD